MTCDLDLWPNDLKINRDHLLITYYLPTKFEACRTKYCWVISCTRYGRWTWPLTYWTEYHKDYLPTKSEASGAKRSWVISCTRLRETDIPTDRPTDGRTCAMQYALLFQRGHYKRFPSVKSIVVNSKAIPKQCWKMIEPKDDTKCIKKIAISSEFQRGISKPVRHNMYVMNSSHLYKAQKVQRLNRTVKYIKKMNAN